MRETDRHEHGPAPGADARWLSGALALILAFMAGEVAAGLAAHSLALISDAAHMLTDAASIALVVVTARLAARPPTGGYTYGLKRAEILSAQANGITLVLLAIWLGYTAIRRLVTPPAVAGGTVLGVALAGVAVNVAVAMLIARAGGRGQPRSLNLAGAFQHVVTDLYAFIATAVAGLVILATGFDRADAIATLVVVVLMLHAGFGLLKDSGRIFLEAAPAGLSPAAVGAAMADRPLGVRGPRPAYLGDHLGPARGLGARAGRAGRGLPRGAGRPRGVPVPRVRDHPRDAPGRPRGLGVRPGHGGAGHPRSRTPLRRRARTRVPSRRRLGWAYHARAAKSRLRRPEQSCRTGRGSRRP